MGAPQIIHSEGGDEMVVLSRRDYEALLARAGDEAAEDAMSSRLIAEAKAALAAGEDVMIPANVWEEIEAAPSPIAALRRWRGLTQVQLAAAMGVSQGFVSDLEGGRKTGSVETLRKVAAALNVPLDALVD